MATLKQEAELAKAEKNLDLMLASFDQIEHSFFTLVNPLQKQGYTIELDTSREGLTITHNVLLGRMNKSTFLRGHEADLIAIGKLYEFLGSKKEQVA